MADWAPKNGIKKVVTLVSDYGPGIDAEKYFKERFTFNGGQVVETLRVPLRNPDFAPFLQKVRDAKPDALFVFVPSGAGAARDEAVRRARPGQGRHQADRHRRRDRRRPAQRHGRRARWAWSPRTTTRRRTTRPLNKKFVEAFKKANNGLRPNFMAVGGYDGMRVIYEALKATKGGRRRCAAGGHEGPDLREPARPDVHRRADPRRRAEHLHAQGREGRTASCYNVEFDVIKDVKDPGKAK